MNENKELKGLNGWLVLVGLGVLIAPFRMLIELSPGYLSLFRDGTWQALTSESSEFYAPYFSSVLILEIVFNVVLLFASVYLIYLYFSKHYFFPKLYILILLASLVFIPFDAWLVSLVIPGIQIFDTETSKEIARSFFAGIIWIPYMLVSKRVKATFIKKGSTDTGEDQQDQLL